MAQGNSASELLDILLDFGESMLSSGAEIARVEDSLSRMGNSYGAVKTSAFVINSSIELTVLFEDGQILTRTRRIRANGGTDFEMLGKLNALSRISVFARLPVEDLRKSVDAIRHSNCCAAKSYAGSLLAAGGFSMFFGGGVLDALVSSLFGLLICFLQRHFFHLSPNKVFFLFVTSFFTSAGVCLVELLLPGLQIDKIVIGDIMLLVPGIAITTAVRDTLIGETIAGITRLADCLVWAAALAAGIMLGISIFAG